MKNVDRIKWQLGLVKDQGIMLYYHGVKRRSYYKKLRNKFGFENWHTMPYELRPYAWKIVRYLNSMEEFKQGVICEIGCGLGDIIRNITAREKYAFDISNHALECAKYLDKKENGGVQYILGSFEDVKDRTPQKIDLLLTVNFIHAIPSEQLKKKYMEILDYIDVRSMIVDVKTTTGVYSHDFNKILPMYKMTNVIWQSGERRVIYLKKQ